jgi:hypothetical protein
MNGLLRIKSILQPNWVILPSHVRRSANQVVDLLANHGVDLKEGDFSCSPSSTSSHPFVIACREIANTKDRPPDGVFRGNMSGQATGRPPGQTASQLAYDGTPPPSTSPQHLSSNAATLRALKMDVLACLDDLHVMSQAISSPPFCAPTSKHGSILPLSNLRALPLHLWSSLVTRLCAPHPEIASPLPMPRLRGKPRRGAAWYAAS